MLLPRRSPGRLASTLIFARCSSSSTTGHPPVFIAVPETVQAHGKTWTDDFAWLKTHPGAVELALRREAAHFRRSAQRSGLDALASQLLSEIHGMLPASTESAPERVGGHELFVRQTPERPQPCYYRRPIAVDQGSQMGACASEEVVLDVNELAKVHGDGISLGQLKLSKCGNLVAFTVAEAGKDEIYSTFIRDLRTGRTAQQPALCGIVGLELAADGTTLLFTQPDDLGRPFRVMKAKAILPSAAVSSFFRTESNLHQQAQEVWREEDPRFFVQLSRTKDWAWLVINSNSKTSSEVHLLPADGVGGLRCVQPRVPGLEYFLEHAAGRLYILSNARGAENYALYSTSTSTIENGEPGWRVVVPPRADVALEDLDVFSAALVLHERCHAGKLRLRVLPLLDPCSVPSFSASYVVTPPPWALSMTAGANADFHANVVRMDLSSPIHPDRPFDWDLEERNWVAVDPGDDAPLVKFDPEEFECTRLAVPSFDGVNIPLTLVRWKSGAAKGAASAETRDGTIASGSVTPGPCLVGVYAAYGHNLPVDILLERVPLLRRGWSIALVHARGGGELGRSWHAAARGPDLKPTSARDVQAAIEHLVAAGDAKKGRFAIEASSAGAVAAWGAVAAMPGAFGAVLLESPFVDVLSTMCDPSLPLTQHEYDEWGNPADPNGMAGLMRICPYFNVKKKVKYPPVFLTCGTGDERVPAWGPLRFAAKLRQGNRANEVLVWPDAYEGHLAGESERYEVKAEHYAWLVKTIM